MDSKSRAEQYKQRIADLLKKLAMVDDDPDTEMREIVDGCFVGTLTIIESLYGANSSQSRALFEAKKAYTKTQYSSSYELGSMTNSLRGTLKNIREELDAGLIRSLATEAAGEVIGDMVALAKTELTSGYTNVAAVLATAALEDALKRKAEELGINPQGKSLDAVISSLKAKSFFHGAQVSIVGSFVRLRNAAMHADWDKIQDADVSSLLGFLEPFLLEHFS